MSSTTSSTTTDQQQREADTVRSAPDRGGHHVPTLDDVDRVLARLSEHLRSPDLEPGAREHISDDIDALLERRRWFMVLDRDSTPS